MNFLEHVAKARVLAPAGIPVPKAIHCVTAEDAAVAAAELGPCMVKAQVPTGKRGKAGGIRAAMNPDEAQEVASAILGMTIDGHRVESVLLEERAAIAREFYAAILTDTESRTPLVLFSTEGGMDIEEVAATRPEALRRHRSISTTASVRRRPAPSSTGSTSARHGSGSKRSSRPLPGRRQRRCGVDRDQSVGPAGGRARRRPRLQAHPR